MHLHTHTHTPSLYFCLSQSSSNTHTKFVLQSWNNFTYFVEYTLLQQCKREAHSSIWSGSYGSVFWWQQVSHCCRKRVCDWSSILKELDNVWKVLVLFNKWLPNFVNMLCHGHAPIHKTSIKETEKENSTETETVWEKGKDDDEARTRQKQWMTG